jgi:YVTN family beta-propeller protein
VKGIFTTTRVQSICLLIGHAVLICTSITAFSLHAEAAEPLISLKYEGDVYPGIFLNLVSNSVAVMDDGNILVSHPNLNFVSLIDGYTFTESHIPVGERPEGIAVDPFNNLVFVANSDSNTVSVIEQTEEGYRNIANVTSGGSPHEVFTQQNITSDSPYSFSAAGGRIVYVINEDLINNDLRYSISIVGESTYGYDDWRNSKNISLDDPYNITDIAVSNYTAYVGRSYSPSDNTVSIIEDIGGEYRNVTNIGVGFSPDIITVSYPFVYVTSPDNNIVSIIYGDRGEYRNIGNVTIGESPSAVAGIPGSNSMYVADTSGNVSVFRFSSEGDNYFNNFSYTNVANITVGSPADFFGIKNNDISADVLGGYFSIYVLDYRGRVSVISDFSNKLQVGVSFEIEPSNAGYINCKDQDQDDVRVSTNQYIYLDYLSPCTAKANKGFQFSSWIEDLGNNSTRIISSTSPSYSPIDWLTNAVGIGKNDTESTLTPTNFGKFVARFEEVPPPFPSEYLIPLYGIIVSSIVGWSIPSIVSWIRAKREGRASDEYHKRIQSLYNDGKLDYADIKSLNQLRTDLSDTYAKGKITEQHYQNLKSETGVLYEEIHMKRIDSLISSNKDDGLLTTIKQEIDDDFAKGKISKEHYDLLNKKIESFENKDENKKDKSQE